MLKVGGEIYNLTDIESRESLHSKIDEWVENNFEAELMSGELDDEISKVHALISEENSEELDGKWFKGQLTINHWYEPLTEFLDGMNISYTVLLNGDVEMSYSGKQIVFTREKVDLHNEDTHYEWCKDGIIRRNILEKFGLYFVKDYYLPRLT